MDDHPVAHLHDGPIRESGEVRALTLGLPLSTLYAFLLVLARVAGLVAFLPIPGVRAAPEQARVALALLLTMALYPAWPLLPNIAIPLSQLVYWGIVECGFGLVAGVAVALLNEGFQMGAQILGLQAGYGYALTIDPTSQSDTGVLQVFLALASGWLGIVLGLDRELIRVLALSLERVPSGSGPGNAAAAAALIRLGSAMLETGLRLAFPVVATLLLIDLALALLGRLQQQLQLLTLAFPAKMLAALLVLASLMGALPKIFHSHADRTLGVLRNLLGP